MYWKCLQDGHSLGEEKKQLLEVWVERDFWIEAQEELMRVRGEPGRIFLDQEEE